MISAEQRAELRHEHIHWCSICAEHECRSGHTLYCVECGLPFHALEAAESKAERFAQMLANGARDGNEALTSEVRENQRLRDDIEALAEKWEAIDAAISPVLGHPAQGAVIEFAKQARALLNGATP